MTTVEELARAIHEDCQEALRTTQAPSVIKKLKSVMTPWEKLPVDAKSCRMEQGRLMMERLMR